MKKNRKTMRKIRKINHFKKNGALVNPPKVLLKKKNVKKLIINIVEDKMVSNTYLVENYSWKFRKKSFI